VQQPEPLRDRVVEAATEPRPDGDTTLVPLDENPTARVERLDREVAALTRQVDELLAAVGEDGGVICRIPNITSDISKLFFRYWAGSESMGRYQEFPEGGFPDDFWRRLPKLPISYRIVPGSTDDIVVRFKLQPGFCYRVIYKEVIGDEIQQAKSLGFWEVGKTGQVGNR